MWRNAGGTLLKTTVMTARPNLTGFLILLSCTFILIYTTNRYILTSDFYAKSDQALDFSPVVAERFYLHIQKWIYLVDAIYLLWKLALITTILYIALFLSEVKSTFRELFYTAIQAEYLFIISAFLKMLWFHFHYPQGTLDDWYHCYPLSLISLFPGTRVTWWYPLQTFNLFEVAYWFVIAAGISRVAAFDFDRSLRLVLSSYLPLLGIWTLIMVLVAAQYNY